ncbi:MAG: anthranilate synthase component I [Myxococcota bacterium]
MVHPDRDSFRALARQGRAVPVVREVLADLDTPLASFLKLEKHGATFLFESVEGGERWGRFSFIGVGSRARFFSRRGRIEIEGPGTWAAEAGRSEAGRDPLEGLRRMLERLRPVEIPGLPRFAGGAVGYLAYDWVRHVERLPDLNPDPLGLPEACFHFPELVLVHDRKRQSLTLIALADPTDDSCADAAYDAAVRQLDALMERLSQPAPLEPAPEPSDTPVEIRSSVSRERYHEIVERARAYIRAGDVFQVVPSQRLSLPLHTDPLQIYRALRVINPSPYLFYLRCGDHVVLGSSPEILVQLEGREITLRPIAGTRPRGRTPEEDRALEKAMLQDPKELAEHIMLVDLGRNDVGRVAEIGSVHVDELHSIERYSHVMHIVSNVRGRIRAGLDAVDLLRATFPAGTLSGAPKVRAMEIIEELEPVRRGLYGGCVGYIDYRGDMDMCIAIRTLLAKDGTVHVQAGGGVVADSDPEREYQETLHKARALTRAIEMAGGGRPR